MACRDDCRRKRATAEDSSLDTAPIVRTLETLINVGAAVGAVAAAFFVMLAGSQHMTAGGSVRALESAKNSRSNALISLAMVILCRAVGDLVRGALGGEQSALGAVGILAVAVMGFIS